MKEVLRYKHLLKESLVKNAFLGESELDKKFLVYRRPLPTKNIGERVVTSLSPFFFFFFNF